MSSTAVNSFVIRFKQEQEMGHGELPWHGFIQHVQSGQEIHFADFQAAMHFIACFVDIKEEGAMKASEE